MAKNQIQCQPGMSLMTFLNRYGSEEQCESALFAARWPQGWHCSRWLMPRFSASTARLPGCCAPVVAAPIVAPDQILNLFPR